MQLNLSLWLTNAERVSKVHKKFGSFLPEQKELFKKIYSVVYNNSKIVSTLMAPTGTGKTHVICVVAKILQDTDNSVAIVTPSNYLKEEFVESKKDVLGVMDKIKIMNLAEYASCKDVFDYVLIDEAHNLKSFIELDNKVVRNIPIKKNTNIYDDLIDQIPPGKPFVARQIPHLKAKEFLEEQRNIK